MWDGSGTEEDAPVAGSAIFCCITVWHNAFTENEIIKYEKKVLKQ